MDYYGQFICCFICNRMRRHSALCGVDQGEDADVVGSFGCKCTVLTPENQRDLPDVFLIIANIIRDRDTEQQISITQSLFPFCELWFIVSACVEHLITRQGDVQTEQNINFIAPFLFKGCAISSCAHCSSYYSIKICRTQQIQAVNSFLKSNLFSSCSDIVFHWWHKHMNYS